MQEKLLTLQTVVELISGITINMAKNNKWFKKVRWSYIPCKWQGWLLYIPMIIFLSTVVVNTNRNTHSVSDFLYQILPYFVCMGVIMHWIASNKS